MDSGILLSKARSDGRSPASEAGALGQQVLLSSMIQGVVKIMGFLGVPLIFGATLCVGSQQGP